MENTYRERLEQLERVVRAVPRGKLDMSSGDSCAAAYAAKDPWFRERGFGGYQDDTHGFFDLSEADEYALFGGNLFFYSPRVPRRAVLANIRRLLAGKPAKKYPARKDTI